MANTKNAVRYLPDWLADDDDLRRSQAYELCRAAAGLKISEIVSWPNHIVSDYMPLQLVAG